MRIFTLLINLWLIVNVGVYDYVEGDGNVHPWAKLIEKETYLVKVIRPAGEDPVAQK